MKKVIFLYSEQNFVWTSMEEIIPYIKGLWRDFCLQEHWVLTVISIDQSKPTDYLKELMASDLIVISCFNAPMAGWLRLLREKIFIQTPWVFYLHNQATIGLWPLFEFGIGELLTCADYFIGTCEGDKLAMELCFEGANTLIHPFSKRSLERLPCEDLRENTGEARDILFIGRISRQKNLESLIKAFAQLSKGRSDLVLHLYGKEDSLGWPNLGIRKEESYLAELEKLAEDQGVSNSVKFYGFVKRDVIQKEWVDKPFVFCSPSLHSDENFGMAALMALEMKGRLVLSRWGGHCNYIQTLPELVQGVCVIHDGSKLKIEQEELVEALNHALSEVKGEMACTDYFSYSKALELLKQNFNTEDKSEKIKLSLSEFGRELLEQRRRYRAHDSQKLFSGEGDPLAVKLYKCYGAGE